MRAHTHTHTHTRMLTHAQEVDRACKDYKDRLEKSTAELTCMKESKRQLKVCVCVCV
jgi:hypothetical protein